MNDGPVGAPCPSRTCRAALTAALLAGALSFGCLGPRLTVLPSGSGEVAAPKPSDCKVEFRRTGVDRAYQELAAIRASGGDSFKNGPEDYQEALRAKACALGADAVIVTKDPSGPGDGMNGVAIRYAEQEWSRRGSEE